jgi:hypothetical protein
MSRFIPVEPEKWGEMVKAMSEVTRLKAEVERLTKTYIDPASILRLTEDGKQREDGTYDTKFIVEVKREGYEHLSQTMIGYWKSIREAKKP